MSLKEGYSKNVITSNIRELVRSGKNNKQAAAIALKSARKSAKIEISKNKKITLASVLKKRKP